MTISLEKAIALLNEKKEDISLNDLGFILTVLRDNATNDDVYEIIDAMIKEKIK